MESRFTLLILYALGAAGLIAVLAKLKTRLELSKAKHWSLSGHANMARRIASLIPFHEYDETHFFRSDAPPEEIAGRRRAGFLRLSKLTHDRFPETLRLTAKVRYGLSDLQFTEAYRVPFQFSGFVRQHLPVGAFVQSSSG